MELIVIVFLTVVSGVFAMSEIAVISARRGRLQQQADEGSAGAKVALELIDSPNRFLSTVQIGITLIGTVAGAFGGATIAEEIADTLNDNPTLAPYSDAIGFTIVVAFTTYLSLVLGELVPKRLALRDPEGLAAKVARPMQLLSQATSPLVSLLSVSTDLVIKLLRLPPADEAPVTEEEIHMLLASGTAAGIFEKAEQDMVAGVFRLGDLRVDALMTPRTEIVSFDVTDTVAEIRRKIAEAEHTRFPVYRESFDHIVGIINSKELLRQLIQNQPIDLHANLMQPLFVPETMFASEVLQQFKQTGVHLALVLDEYGGIQGLVTMTDVLEAVVGELDVHEPDVVLREDGSWLLDGTMPVDEFKLLLDIKELPSEHMAYQTVAGFIMLHEGRIPETGDNFEWKGLYFEVMDMDSRRIDKVLVKRLSVAPPENSEA